jgi:hypothetical protein
MLQYSACDVLNPTTFQKARPSAQYPSRARFLSLVTGHAILYMVESDLDIFRG